MPTRPATAISSVGEWLLVALVAALAYGRSLGADFVYDDVSLILRNPIVDEGHLRDLLTTDFWGGRTVGTWRPLAVFTLSFDHLAGTYHATNVVIHAATAILVGRIARTWVAGVLFAALAVNSEAVCALSGRADLLAAFLGLVAWQTKRVPLAALALFGALLCKESALVLPVFLLLAGSGRRRALGWLVAVAAYFALRHACFGGLDLVDVKPENNPLVGEPLGVRILTACHLFALSLRLMVAPVQLSPDYSLAAIVPDRTLSLDVVAGAAAFVALAAAAWFGRTKTHGPLLLLVAFAPLTHLVTPLPAIFAERLLYLPAAGFVLALAALPRRLAPLLLVLAAGNAARSFVRAGDWQSDARLWAAAIETQPRSATAWVNHGVVFLEAERREEAAAAFREAIAILPGWALPRTYLGLAARDEMQLRAAVLLDPDLEAAAVNLAVFLARNHRDVEARAVLWPYVRRHPEAYDAERLLSRLTPP